MSYTEKDLRFLCQCLASADNGQQITDEIKGQDVNWSAVVAIANRNLLVPALWIALRDKGVIDSLDETLCGYLEEMYRHNLERNRGIVEQVKSIAFLLNQHGIEPVLLKGSSALVEGVFSDPGVRCMLDIDLLIEPEQTQRAWEILVDSGYQSVSDQTGMPQPKQGLGAHLPRLFKDGVVAGVEMHNRALSRKCGEVLAVDDVVKRSLLLEDGGCRYRVLSPEDQLKITFYHSQVSHENHKNRKIDLRQLHHFMAQVKFFDQRIGWSKFQEQISSDGYGEVFDSYLYMLEQLFGIALPLAQKTEQASQYFNESLQLFGKAPTSGDLLKHIFLHIRSELSPSTISLRYGVSGKRDIIWYTFRHLFYLVKKYSHLGVLWRWIKARKSLLTR